MRSIARHRKSMDMTQFQLAEAIGVTSLTVSRWESGTQNPPIKKLKKIAEALNCSMEDLVKEI